MKLNATEKTPWAAHVSMLIACAIWGLMSPMTKDVTETHLISGVELVTFRVTGAALCFWVASLFVKREPLARKKDYVMLFLASMLCVVLNQCCYTIGISYTSPVDASIMSTTMPIFTLILAALILKEPITWKKVLGIILGATGAILLVLWSKASTPGDRPMLGNLLCISAQCSFALYLTLFKHLIQRYSVITTMKWMMLFAALVITPFTTERIAALPWTEISAGTWWETAYVVVGGTFVAYIFSTYGQKKLRPTVVSVYNYVQPLVSFLASVIMLGLGFGWTQAIAIPLVFCGVWLVTQSKSRRDLNIERRNRIKTIIHK